MEVKKAEGPAGNLLKQGGRGLRFQSCRSASVLRGINRNKWSLMITFIWIATASIIIQIKKDRASSSSMKRQTWASNTGASRSLLISASFVATFQSCRTSRTATTVWARSRNRTWITFHQRTWVRKESTERPRGSTRRLTMGSRRPSEICSALLLIQRFQFWRE